MPISPSPLTTHPLLTHCCLLSLRWMLEHITGSRLTSLHQRHSSLPSLLSSLPPAQLSALQTMVAHRAAGQPLQYLLGDVSFCSLRLLCRPPTLIPRPETEHWTAWLLHTLRHCPASGYPSSLAWPASVPFPDSAAIHPPQASPPSPLRVLDLCTGSGCVALALAAHLGCEVVGVDVAETALALARDNAAEVARQIGAPVKATFVRGDLRGLELGAVVGGYGFDVVVANPPYVGTGEVPGLQTEVAAWEDWGALDGGEQGLDLYRPVVRWAMELGRKGVRGCPELVLEIGGKEQVKAVTTVCADAGFDDVRVYADQHGKQRWIAARRGQG